MTTARLEDELRGALLALCALAVSVVYMLPYYRHGMLEEYDVHAKPYVFRQLSVQVIDFLESAGLVHQSAVLLFVAVSAIAFLFAMLSLMGIAWHSNHKEVIALLLLAIFVMIFQRYLKPYDLPTAFFFTLCLTLMVSWQPKAYLFAFFLSSINRETTILLLLVWMAYFWKWLKPARRYWLYVIAQAVTFVTVQAMIRYAFRDAPGSSVWISPAQNFAAHWDEPLRTLIGLAVISALLWLVFRHWQSKPIVLRTAFVVLTPSLALLYIVAGQAFEYRVFAEVYSVTALLAMPVRRVA